MYTGKKKIQYVQSDIQFGITQNTSKIFDRLCEAFRSVQIANCVQLKYKKEHLIHIIYIPFSDYDDNNKKVEFSQVIYNYKDYLTDLSITKTDTDSLSTTSLDPTKLSTAEPDPTKLSTAEPDPTKLSTAEPDPTKLSTAEPDPTDENLENAYEKFKQTDIYKTIFYDQFCQECNLKKRCKLCDVSQILRVRNLQFVYKTFSGKARQTKFYETDVINEYTFDSKDYSDIVFSSDDCENEKEFLDYRYFFKINREVQYVKNLPFLPQVVNMSYPYKVESYEQFYGSYIVGVVGTQNKFDFWCYADHRLVNFIRDIKKFIRRKRENKPIVKPDNRCITSAQRRYIYILKCQIENFLNFIEFDKYKQYILTPNINYVEEFLHSAFILNCKYKFNENFVNLIIGCTGSSFDIDNSVGSNRVVDSKAGSNEVVDSKAGSNRVVDSKAGSERITTVCSSFSNSSKCYEEITLETIDKGNLKIRDYIVYLKLIKFFDDNGKQVDFYQHTKFLRFIKFIVLNLHDNKDKGCTKQCKTKNIEGCIYNRASNIFIRLVLEVNFLMGHYFNLYTPPSLIQYPHILDALLKLSFNEQLTNDNKPDLRDIHTKVINNDLSQLHKWILPRVF